MKMAILIPGLLREYERSFRSIKKNLMITDHVDVFIYTWEYEEDFVDDKWGFNYTFKKDAAKRRPDGWSINERSPKNTYSDIQKPTTDIIQEIEKITPITRWKSAKQSEKKKELAEIQKLFKNYSSRWSPLNYSSCLYALYECNKLKNQTFRI